MTSNSQLYFRQLLAGRDFAVDDDLATQMANYVYLLGDRDAHEAAVIDAAYAPSEIVGICEDDGMRLTGAIVTHYHADHAGGALGGIATIAGLADLLAIRDVPIHAHADEISWLADRAGVSKAKVNAHRSGDVIAVGDLPLAVIHTPGHTEGSQCILFEGCLITGDTLFLDGCGRTDLPGGNAGELFESLTRRLASIGDDVPIYPGHAYSHLPTETMGAVRKHNPVLETTDKARWLARFGN